MSTTIRYLRLYLHRPPQADGSASESGTTASRREAIGYLSQYGDILRVSFDEAYIRNPQRPTLSLSYQGADEAATQQILASARDARLVWLRRSTAPATAPHRHGVRRFKWMAPHARVTLSQRR